MAGHVHDVGRYAPEGFKLLVSNYALGGVEHVFGRPNQTEVVRCFVSAHEDEEAALAAFQARYAPTIPAPASPPEKGADDARNAFRSVPDAQANFRQSEPVRAKRGGK